MFNLKTKWFNKWASKNSLSDTDLKHALDDLKENKGVSNLGGNLYKIRVSRENEGKSGGYRSLLAYKKDERAVFIYAFAKNEKDNLDKSELSVLKKLALDLTSLDTEELKRQIKLGNLVELGEIK
ncbi:MAG TPA: type II toxin-antitoxin system RelE/ParE family toxin [Spirochaetota bacterium]|nr:type II toxin-antitoxin system RelE/ParE family toxin [Spirochaetota bacterium]